MMQDMIVSHLQYDAEEMQVRSPSYVAANALLGLPSQFLVLPDKKELKYRLLI